MAIDRDPRDRGPNSYKPARDRAPKGYKNKSIKESGGQLEDAGPVDSTPSMRRKGGVSSDDGAWDGPTPSTPGKPPAR